MAHRQNADVKKRIEALSPVEIAYLAGIIDGEGHIGLSKQKRYNTPRGRLTITNTDSRLLLWLRDKIGGSITTNHADVRTGGKWRKCFIWQVVSRQACEVLKACLPMLIVKREQAQIMIGYFELKRRTSYKTAPEEMERLNTAVAAIHSQREKHHHEGLIN